MADRNLYPGNQPTAGYGEYGTRKVLSNRNAAFAAADIGLNRTLGLLVAPANFVVTGVRLIITDIDSGGAPTVAFTVGDSGNAARFVAASTIGQTGGTTTTLAAIGDRYKFPAATEVTLTFTTAAATPVAGSVSFELEGYQE
jgi:hypothetical protein